MRFIIAIFLLLSLVPVAHAYPKEKVLECELGAKQAPVMVGVPTKQIEDWCKCTLDLITVQNKNDREASAICGHRYFK